MAAELTKEVRSVECGVVRCGDKFETFVEKEIWFGIWRSW